MPCAVPALYDGPVSITDAKYADLQSFCVHRWPSLLIITDFMHQLVMSLMCQDLDDNSVVTCQMSTNFRIF